MRRGFLFLGRSNRVDSRINVSEAAALDEAPADTVTQVHGSPALNMSLSAKRQYPANIHGHYQRAGWLRQTR
jgi:hypothetical protein